MTDADVPRSDLTVSKVLETVVRYYGEDPKGRRSTDTEGNCLYCGPDGKHCAVALFADLEVRAQLARKEGEPIEDLRGILPDYMADIVVVDGANASDFWRSVQELHDESVNWDMTNKCLSAQGERKFDQLKQEYDPNLPI